MPQALKLFKQESELHLNFQIGRNLAQVAAEKKKSNSNRVRFAESFCGRVLTLYWRRVALQQGSAWRPRTAPISFHFLSEDHQAVCSSLADCLVQYPLPQAGYLLGTLYTALLPDGIRARLGAYYTPPALVNRLIQIATESGFDWKSGRIVDPACGGAAFLAPLACRMAEALRGRTPDFILDAIASRLCGLEVDPFAAWMSQTLLEIALLPFCLSAKRRLPEMITIADALSVSDSFQNRFDLVIGNPPYGRITLPEKLRNKYERSLFGHANLYGLFTDLAIRLLKDQGLIAYVTPTSFLGGQYFKALRTLLAAIAKPQIVEFVSERIGVFEDVLQETMLAVFKKGEMATQSVHVRSLVSNGSSQSVQADSIGNFAFAVNEAPWFIPRTALQGQSFGRALAMRWTLADYGFTVSTGPLVWNRHKKQLKMTPGPNRLPLIWAESVTADGRFRFSSAKKNHQPFFELKKRQDHLVTKTTCILVQRTTAKEQHRRLIAAVLPQDFLNDHRAGVVIENHLNIVRPDELFAEISLEALCALINSECLDQIFRCINGSVAVSAYELNALPLPDPASLHPLQDLISRQAERSLIETFISNLYGLNT